MCERQKHGFMFEDMIKKEFSFKDSDDIKYDAFLDKHPVSIKTSKLRTNDNFIVFLSSVYNQVKLKHNYIYLIIGLYQKKEKILDNPKNIKDVLVFKIPREEWLKHFNIDVVDKLEKEKTYLKFKCFSKEHQKRTQKAWRAYVRKVKKEWNKDEKKAIQLNFKRDSKGQCRIQCSITKRNLFKHFGKYEIGLKEIEKAS